MFSNYSMDYSFISNSPLKVLMKTVMSKMFKDKVRNRSKCISLIFGFVVSNTIPVLICFLMIVSE